MQKTGITQLPISKLTGNLTDTDFGVVYSWVKV